MSVNNEQISKKRIPVPAEQFQVEDGQSKEFHLSAYDKALELAAAREGEEEDLTAEKKLVKKIDLYLMPLVSFKCSEFLPVDPYKGTFINYLPL